MSRKKFVMIICAFCLAFMTACTSAEGASGQEEECSVVCTVFPAYDWTRTLLEQTQGAVSVQYLFDDGADVHSFQPGAEDYVTIAESDVFIYIGGNGSEWIHEALAQNPNPDRIVIDLAEVEGMTLLQNLSAGHEEHEEHEHEEHEHEAYDEHIWMSLQNAVAAVDAIEDALVAKMPADAERISSNKVSYIEALQTLDTEYRTMAETCEDAYVLVPDRFPFLYLTESYGISYDAAFAGCRTESEADFEMIIRLAELADENEVPVLLITEVSDGALAQTVNENTEHSEREILVVDSMQAVTAGMVAEGKTYLDTMKNNYDVLSKALGFEQ